MSFCRGYFKEAETSIFYLTLHLKIISLLRLQGLFDRYKTKRETYKQIELKIVGKSTKIKEG